MPNAWRRVARIVAVAFTVALLLAAGHRHEQHVSGDAGCTECVVAHHSPALSGAQTVVLAPLAAPTEIPPVAIESEARRWERALETGRAPPRALLA